MLHQRTEPFLSRAALLFAVCIAMGCDRAPPLIIRRAPQDSLLGAAAHSYQVRGDEFAMSGQDKWSTDERSVTGVVKGQYSRAQLLSIARHLAGPARRPSIRLMANEAAAEACARARFAVLRGGATPDDSEACSDGVILWTDNTTNLGVYWGHAAPPVGGAVRKNLDSLEVGRVRDGASH